MDTYTDEDGDERCDDCDEELFYCTCECSCGSGENIHECACGEG